jgi:hypothetical protein
VWAWSGEDLVYGALRPGDGQAVTLTAPSRNSVGYQRLLAAVEQAKPTGKIAVITDNLQPLQLLHPDLAGRAPTHRLDRMEAGASLVSWRGLPPLGR